MKLFFTGNSPYARRPRIAVREAGLGGKVEEVDLVSLADNAAKLMEYGPGAKVPGLLTDDGAFICETLLITGILDDLAGGKLYPGDAAARAFAMEVEGIGGLLMDSLFTRSHEKRRADGERSQGVIDKEAARAARCYDALEARVDKLGTDPNLGAISAVSSLGYADWRHPDDNWRDGRPKLTAWNDEMLKRPAFGDTKPVF